MSARPFYRTTYHREDWRLADAFRLQPGWGSRVFTVRLADLGQHTEDEIVDVARQHAPAGYRLTSVELFPSEGPTREIWSTPPDARLKRAADGVRDTGEGPPHG